MGLATCERKRIEKKRPAIFDRIDEALRVIRLALETFRNPAILWSGGKDSTVLMHLIRNRTKAIDLPVICFREPWMPEKLAFTNKVIADWNLTTYDYPPSAVALCKGNGRIDVMQHYTIGREMLILARGTEPPEEGKPWLCGRDTFLARPRGSIAFPWDALFCGHKSSDDDPTSGPVPLNVDVLDAPGSASTVFPLRTWTDADVFEYIETFSVPYDENRYGRDLHGEWFVKPDKRLNPDYYHTCFACCDPDAPAFVKCPKLGLKINNVADKVPFIAPRAAYCNLRTVPHAA